MKNERLLRVFLIIVSFSAAQVLLAFLLNALLAPYDGMTMEMRPEGWMRTMNDFFEGAGASLIGIAGAGMAFCLSYALDKGLFPKKS